MVITMQRKIPEFFAASFPCLIAALALPLLLGACNRTHPLPPELQAIVCPKGKEAHASTMIGKAKVTYLCISQGFADNPSFLRCGAYTGGKGRMVCEDEGGFLFTRAADGKVYAHTAVMNLPLPEAEDASVVSGLRLSFWGKQPTGASFGEAETDREFLLDDGKRLLPPAFTFVKGTLCHRYATVLHIGSCYLEAKSASLNWNISISILKKPGTPVSEDEYRRELAFWLKYLDKIVDDPQK
jgi:hypothetical protein